MLLPPTLTLSPSEGFLFAKLANFALFMRTKNPADQKMTATLISNPFAVRDVFPVVDLRPDVELESTRTVVFVLYLRIFFVLVQNVLMDMDLGMTFPRVAPRNVLFGPFRTHQFSRRQKKQTLVQVTRPSMPTD